MTSSTPPAGATGRLPDFLVIGVERGGTTTIARYLAAHDDVFLPARKELHFFDRPGGTLDDYRAEFGSAGGATAVGEATPSYLFDPRAVTAIAAVVPNAALVVSLRDPVERAWSHYWYRWTWRAEERSFEEAVDEELAGHVVPGAEYLARGRYAEQLSRLESLHPDARVRVQLLDDLRDRPAETVAGLYRFIGVRDHPIPDLGDFRNRPHRIRSLTVWRATSRWRRGPLDDVSASAAAPSGIGPWLTRRLDAWNAVPFQPPPVPTTVRGRLLEYFAGETEALEHRLQRDLSAWRDGDREGAVATSSDGPTAP